MLTIQFGLGGAVFLVFVAIVWRLSSRRTSIPCPSWLAWMVELDNPFAKDHNAASIVRRLGCERGHAVLDAGCGPGRLTIPLAKAVGPDGEVVAVDIQPAMLHRAREKARMAGLTNIRFVETTIGPGTLGTERFDRAVLVTVLGEIPDRLVALQEIFHAMRPGGILSVTEIVFDPHYQKRETVLDLAVSAGFREKKFFGNRLAYTLHLEKPTGR
jgi:ubiquinone/menaquinone biosynthesis C-methylase UbiE